MSDLESALEDAQKACDSISTLYFHPGGIFTNSIIKNNEITNLITDLNIDLQQGSDGDSSKKKLFLSYDDELQALRRYDSSMYREDETYYSGDYNNDDITIKVPQKPVLDELSMATNSYHLNRLAVIDEKLQQLFQQRLKQPTVYNAENVHEQRSEGVNLDLNVEEITLLDSLIDVLTKLNENYPINNIKEYLEKLKQRNSTLDKEISELKAIDKEVNAQLQKFQVDLNDKDLLEFQKYQTENSLG